MVPPAPLTPMTGRGPLFGYGISAIVETRGDPPRLLRRAHEIDIAILPEAARVFPSEAKANQHPFQDRGTEGVEIEFLWLPGVEARRQQVEILRRVADSAERG